LCRAVPDFKTKSEIVRPATPQSWGQARAVHRETGGPAECEEAVRDQTAPSTFACNAKLYEYLRKIVRRETTCRPERTDLTDDDARTASKTIIHDKASIHRSGAPRISASGFARHVRSVGRVVAAGRSAHANGRPRRDNRPGTGGDRAFTGKKTEKK